MPGESADSLGLTGKETFTIEGLGDVSSETVEITATAGNGAVTPFRARVRIDTPKEAEYYRHGGILQYVLRQLATA
jgi:aconitate hydratase